MDVHAGKKVTLTGQLAQIRARAMALKPATVLLAMYGVFSLARLLLAFLLTVTPEVQPDGSLYLHLSRSIIRDGALLFRGQPIRYEYVLYPLLLSPLHLLPAGWSVFRAAQVFNVLAMHLAVFPAYALARDVTGSRRTATIVALLTLMMPEFFITQQLMTESVGFPLILAACYAFYRYWDAPPSLKVSLLWGALTLALYTLKPGHAALPACLLAAAGLRGLHQKSLATAFNALGGALFFAALYALYRMLLVWGFGMTSATASLYETQTHPLTWEHLAQTLNGLFVYAAYVPMAFAFLPLLVPAAHLRAYGEKDRWALGAFLAAILVTVLGTLYVIYYDEVADGSLPYAARVHVRYVAAFLPVLLAFLFSPRLQGRGMNAGLVAGTAFVAAAVLLLGPVPSGSGWSHNADAFLLAPATFDANGVSGRMVWPAVSLAFLALSAYLLFKTGLGGRLRRLTALFLAVSFIISGAVAAGYYRYHQGSLYPQDAQMIPHYVQTFSAPLGVVRDGAAMWPEAVELDVVTRTGLPVVELDDLIGHTAADGTTGSFLPRAYWMERPTHPVGAPDALVLSTDNLYDVSLSQEVLPSVFRTPGGAYTVVPLTPGVPWIHSALSGFAEGGWVREGSRFTLYDKEILERGSLTLNVQARGGEGSVLLTMVHGTQTAQVALTESLSWYFASFTVENPGEPFTVTFSASGGNGNALVETYLVE